MTADSRVGQDQSSIDDAREIVGLFRGLRRHLVQRSRAELARSGLTAAQVSVVSLLGNRDAMTLTELSRELELSHSTVSGIVDRLHAKGVIQRRPHPEDRRYTQISLVERVKRNGTFTTREGAVGPLESALAAATPDQRRAMKEGLTLFREFIEQSAPATVQGRGDSD
ncbi:MarR family winged helix-turn-helix transcriptional regulator [Microlunatus sp. Gsoil 973]|uniref:MarR family winged helix-turn-helix transcriptional regulator n=1 Tax=Microlunatus sp. Gsoil 973 TaxID=2672569 RepID=UPI0018A8764F|nr:MarR family transcriptional regulator [Microlunatus sp. Gsoil 973]